MSTASKVLTVVETTKPVKPVQAFEFWRNAALKNVGIVDRSDPHEAFSANRLAALSTHTTLLLTESSPVSVEGDLRHVRRAGRDEVVVSFFLAGHGYLEQGHCGHVVGVGDIGFLRLDRPFAVGGLSPYREIRFSVTRSDFEARVGNADALAGHHIRASPSTELLTTYMHDVARSATGMSEAEAGIAIEGALHIVRSLVGGQDDGDRASSEVLRSLARVHIQRHSHDPSYGPQAMTAALNVSRSKLYRAFADGEEIAAEIRDARLDRVHRRLTSAFNDRTPINVLIPACGFTDAPSFSKAFRRRFGMSAKDARALRRG
ncbi:helix-turn-helix domain-containing protein [Methylobacterium sp. W2]|uniref:helix-turn-helix domain-containing protein n=1 Tax=Methylobacterium sp. W2 TaxID=2598107 RepID=UPI001D0C89EA|nr:helix-turn-helix domain-containing protein [Methylobacterium sp. W2]MCC0807951.1 helix-turn-helix domain-containing protein [Methylobacterium sp. W2]